MKIEKYELHEYYSFIFYFMQIKKIYNLIKLRQLFR